MPAVDFRSAKLVEPIPAGKYLLRVTRATEGISQTGDSYISIGAEVVEPEEYGGRFVSGFLNFSPDRIDETFTALVAMGFNAEELRSGVVEVNASDLEGCEFYAVVGVRHSDEYGDQNVIRRFLLK
ncbi:MAG: hypothetical protein QXS68_03035 [Candidatus Methanomethylicaceae archaeon]